MDILKEIICLCMNGCDIEAIFRDFPSEKRREYLQYTKLLWENHILVEMLPEHQCLDAGLLGLILGNFDGNPELIRFWLKTPIYCAGVPEVMDTWQGYGLSCAEYVPDIARQEPCLYVGKYSEAQCQQLLHTEWLCVLFRVGKSASKRNEGNLQDSDHIFRCRVSPCYDSVIANSYDQQSSGGVSTDGSFSGRGVVFVRG